MRGRRTSVETQCIESLAAAPRRHDRTEAASEVSEYSQNERSWPRGSTTQCTPADTCSIVERVDTVLALTSSAAALIRGRSGSRDDSRPELSVCVAGLRRIQLRDALTQHGEEAIDFVRRPRRVKQVSAVSGQRSRGASLNYMGLTAPVTNAATSLRCRCVYCSVDRERDIDVPTRAVIVDSDASSLNPLATESRADWKQAA